MLRKQALYSFLKTSELIKSASDDLKYHYDNDISVVDNVFRPGSEKYFSLIREARSFIGTSIIKESDMDLLMTDLGNFGIFEGRKVPLDFPIEYNEKVAAKYQGKEVTLNQPKRGGSKKFYVYVNCNGKVKKISFGSKDMPMRISEDERRKSFVARHKCETKRDKCTAGYWACAIGRFPKLTGAKKSYRYW